MRQQDDTHEGEREEEREDVGKLRGSPLGAAETPVFPPSFIRPTSTSVRNFCVLDHGDCP